MRLIVLLCIGILLLTEITFAQRGGFLTSLNFTLITDDANTTVITDDAVTEVLTNG